MNSAEVVASRLASKFLEEGNYTSAALMGGAAPSYTSRPSGMVDVDPLFSEHGYGGLAVQAVGYEAGADAPRVHVYVSKGSRQRIDSVPTSDGEVEIEVNRIGRLMVKPEQSSKANHRG